MAINLPHVRQPIVGGDGIATQPWYAWFGRIQAALNAGTISDDEAAAAISAIATALGSPDGTAANIPPLNFLPKTTTVTGSATVDVDGSLAGGGVTLSVNDDSITNVKLADMANKTVKARKTAATGDPEDCTVSEVLDFVPGTPTKGDLIVRDTSAMARIPASTLGHVLTSNGAGALPTYQAPAAGGTWTTVKKTSDESRTSSATLTNDSQLTVALGAGARYVIRCRAFYTIANATMDFQWAAAYSGTFSTACYRRVHSLPGTATGTDNETTRSADVGLPATGMVGTGSGLGSLQFDLIINTTTAGTLALQWAQNTSDAGACTVLGGSYLEYMTT